MESPGGVSGFNFEAPPPDGAFVFDMGSLDDALPSDDSPFVSPFLGSDSPFEFSASPLPGSTAASSDKNANDSVSFSLDDIPDIDMSEVARYEAQQEYDELELSIQGDWNVVQLMQTNSPLLTSLHVLPYDSLADVAAALPSNTCLTSLTCSLDTPPQFRAMAVAIGRDRSLKHLSIDWPHLVLNSDENQMQEAENVLAESFVTNQGLTDLVVRSSDAMFRAIVANTRLRRVTIETGTKGDVSILADAEHLEYLRIGWGQSNNLDTFVNKLTEAARDHALEELDMCSPGGRYDGAQLSEFLKRTSRLKAFSLRGRFVAENDIAAGIRCNASLTSLSIHGLNSDPRTDRTELCKAISQHKLLKQQILLLEEKAKRAQDIIDDRRVARHRLKVVREKAVRVAEDPLEGTSNSDEAPAITVLNRQTRQNFAKQPPRKQLMKPKPFARNSSIMRLRERELQRALESYAF